MFRLLIIKILLLTPILGLATVQIKDRLIINEDTFNLFSFPLDDYLHMERLLNNNELGLISSGCTRDYFATWKIRNDSLFLIQIQKGCSTVNPEYYDLKLEFGSDEPFASWYSAETYCTKDVIVYGFQNNTETLYENEIVFLINNGLIVKKKIFSNARTHQSELTKTQFALEEYVYRNIIWDSLPELKKETRLVYVLIQSGQTLKPDSIWISRSSGFESIDRQVINAAKKIHDWDIYRRRNEIYKMRWLIILEINDETKEKYAP